MAAGALAALLTAGCAPPGIDGDLVDDWPAMAEPQMLVTGGRGLPRSRRLRHPQNSVAYKPVSCTDAHQWETFRRRHLHRRAGGAEDPAAGGRGGPGGRLRGVLGGGRQVRRRRAGATAGWRCGCSIPPRRPGPTVPAGSAANSPRSTRSIRSIAGEPAGRADRHGARSHAAATARTRSSTWCRSPATKPHQYEYVGTWFAPNETMGRLRQRGEMIHKRCRSLVAKFGRDPRRQHNGVPQRDQLLDPQPGRVGRGRPRGGLPRSGWTASSPVPLQGCRCQGAPDQLRRESPVVTALRTAAQRRLCSPAAHDVERPAGQLLTGGPLVVRRTGQSSLVMVPTASGSARRRPGTPATSSVSFSSASRLRSPRTGHRERHRRLPGGQRPAADVRVEVRRRPARCRRPWRRRSAPAGTAAGTRWR